jgi:hypothetical protein
MCSFQCQTSDWNMILKFISIKANTSTIFHWHILPETMDIGHLDGTHLGSRDHVESKKIRKLKQMLVESLSPWLCIIPCFPFPRWEEPSNPTRVRCIHLIQGKPMWPFFDIRDLALRQEGCWLSEFPNSALWWLGICIISSEFNDGAGP